MYDELGLDEDRVVWQDLALCAGLDTNLFFDEYESDEQTAKTVDEMCSLCPVRKQCLMQAIEDQETGAWGGVYVSSGKTDESKNTHKTPADWKRMKEDLV